MKRILSMALVLIMALTFISAISVAVYAEGTKSKIVVYKQDFEGDATNYFSTNMTGVKEDNNIPGNHHAYVTITPETVVYGGATALTGTNVSLAGGDFRLYNNCYTYRMTTKASINLEHRCDRVYEMTWKGYFGSSNPEVPRTRASKNTSGLSHTKSWEGYNGKDTSKIVKVGQWWGSYNWLNRSVDPENPTWEAVTGINTYDSETGWNTFGYSNIGYGIWDGTNTATINAEGYTSDTITNLFFQWNLVNKFRDLLIANKAYAGGGFELADQKVTLDNGTVYEYKGGYITDPELVSKMVKSNEMFTITAEDVAKYDDMAKVDMSGNKYLPKTAEEIAALPDSERYYDKDGVQTEYLPLVKTWHLFEDCTALKSAKKLEEFKTVFNNSITEVGIDDIQFTVDAMLYNDTVTADEGITVKAVTNTYTGESQTINGSGTINNVNDYFGTVYTVSGDIDGIKATYNGEIVETSGSNGTYTFVIAPEKITKNGELKITALEKVVVVFDDTEDDGKYRAINGGNISIQTIDGNKVAVFDNWSAATLVDTYTKKKTDGSIAATLAGIYPRFTYEYKDNSIVIGDRYFYSYDYKYMDKDGYLDISRNQMFINISNSLTALPTGWGCYPLLTDASLSDRSQFYVSVAGVLNSETGWRTVAKNDIIVPSVETKRGSGDSLASTAIASFQMEFKGLTDNGASSLILVETKKAVENNMVDGTLDREKAIAELQAVLDAKDYKILIDNLKFETVTEAKKVSVSAENAGVKINGINYEDGKTAKVGKGYKSTIQVTADEGYKLKSVKINGEEQAIGETGVVEIKNIFNADANIVVIAEASYVAPSVTVSEYKTATNYVYKVGDVDETSPYTVVMYGKIAGAPENYGFAFSNGEASVKLAANGIGAEGVFAIRVVGGAILPGSYTAVPYWTDGEEKTGEAQSIIVE